MSIYPTKEQLKHDYWDLNLTQQEIAEKYGFKTNQPIMRLIKKYDLKKTKSQQSHAIYEKKWKPSKEELSKKYTELGSVVKVSKFYKVGRKVVQKWFSDYELSTTYFNDYSDFEQYDFDELCKSKSLKEISIETGFDVGNIRNRIKVLPEIIYTPERLKEIINLYDIHNQGFTKQLRYDDPNVLNSIYEITENHHLESDKLTERVYRILNDVEPEETFDCKYTGKYLKFYTLKDGYGGEYQQSREGFYKFGNEFFPNYSKISQELFWKIENNLNNKNDLFFKEFSGNEYSLKITKEDRNLFGKEIPNKFYYNVDFKYENKIIEFDGTYFHKITEEKDKIRNEFYTFKGFQLLIVKETDYIKNPEKELQRCLKFLNE